MQGRGFVSSLPRSETGLAQYVKSGSYFKNDTGSIVYPAPARRSWCWQVKCHHEKHGHLSPVDVIRRPVGSIRVASSDAFVIELFDPGFGPVTADVGEGVAANCGRRCIAAAVLGDEQHDSHLCPVDIVRRSVGVVGEAGGEASLGV